jgi:hypothetical protein
LVMGHSSEWRASRDLLPSPPLTRIDRKKPTFTFVSSGHGLSVHDEFPKGARRTASIFVILFLRRPGGPGQPLPRKQELRKG